MLWDLFEGLVLSSIIIVCVCAFDGALWLVGWLTMKVFGETGLLYLVGLTFALCLVIGLGYLIYIMYDSVKREKERLEHGW